MAGTPFGIPSNPREDMKKIAEYIDALSEAIDYDIEPDGMGSHVVIIDDDITVTMRENEQGTGVTVLSIVAPSLPKGISYQDVEEMMDMASGPLYGGAGLGRLPVLGSMVLFQFFPYDRTPKEKFTEAMGEFVDLAQEYYEKFAEMGDGYDDDEEDGEDRGDWDEEDEDGEDE